MFKINVGDYWIWTTDTWSLVNNHPIKLSHNYCPRNQFFNHQCRFNWRLQSSTNNSGPKRVNSLEIENPNSGKRLDGDNTNGVNIFDWTIIFCLFQFSFQSVATSTSKQEVILVELLLFKHLTLQSQTLTRCIYILWAILGLLLFNSIFSRNFNAIQTRIDGIEGDFADHLTNTTTLYLVTFNFDIAGISVRLIR